MVSCNMNMLLTLSLHFHRDKPLGRSTDEHIDNTIVKDLVSDQDALVAREVAKAEKKQRKANQRKLERLKAEKKKANGSNKENIDDNDDDDDMMANFAKGGSRKTKRR